MEVGSLVIANDLIGFVTQVEEGYIHIQDSSDLIHKVVSNQVHLIIDPIKYLYMLHYIICRKQLIIQTKFGDNILFREFVERDNELP